MGHRGPAKKPTAMKVLQGNPGKRRLPENEPRPRIGLPEAPEWLEGEGRRLWEELGPELLACGLLTLVDGPSLAVLCEAWGHFVRARGDVERYGTTVVQQRDRPDGSVQVSVNHSPYMLQKQRAYAIWRVMMREFGLSPAARANLSAGRSEREADVFDDFLRRRG